MTHIVLIRPGATDFSEQGRIQGNLDMPLNAAGAADLARLAREIEGQGIETLYYSETEPAQGTALALAESLGLKAKKLSHFENLNQGLWQGMTVEEVKRKQPTVYRQWQETPECVCPPDGEPVCDCQERIREALSKLLRKHRGETLGVVAPEPLASLLRACLVRGELGDLWRGGKPGAWERIEVNGLASDPTRDEMYRGIPGKR